MPATLATFGLISLADRWDDVASLALAHYAELAHWPDLPLQLDRDRHLALEAAGMLRTFGVLSDGHLVGYSSYLVAPALLHSYLVTANHLALYLAPEHRGHGVGRDLIAHCDAALKAEGVGIVFLSSHVRQSIGSLLRRCGYELVDEQYAKRLDRAA